MKLVAEWARLRLPDDRRAATRASPSRDTPRPPEIKRLWHNSWRAQLGDLAGPIEAYVEPRRRRSRADDVRPLGGCRGAAVEAIEALEDLAESIPEGVELLRDRRRRDADPAQRAVQGLVLLHEPAARREARQDPAHRDRARREAPRGGCARSGASGSSTRGAGARAAAGDAPGNALGGFDLARPSAPRPSSSSTRSSRRPRSSSGTDPSKVTPPNRASITLLAEEDGRTCLLTGDAAEEEILDGLKAAGRIVDGHFRCNVVKVQHHGAEHNLSQEFAGHRPRATTTCSAPTAPTTTRSPSSSRRIVETRLRRGPRRPFTLWFNCSPARTLPTRRKALRAAIGEATKVAAKHPTITVNVLDDAHDSHEITV